MKRLYFATMAAGMAMAAVGASRPMPEYLKSAVVYQIVLHNFTQTGTFKAARAMLDHVRSTGADVVYLTPFFEMDRDMDRTYWSPRQIKSGYDSPLNPYRVADYNKVDPIYGTDKDFDAFCAKAHSLGMKVYLDLVYLHCGPTCVLKDLAPDALQRNPDGSLKLNNYNFPLINYKSKAARKYLIDSMLHWIRRGADGFRCDVGYQVPLEFWEEATAACWKVKPDLVMINEGKPTEYLKTAFDSCYDFPWSFTIRRMIVSGTPGGKSPKHGTFAEKMDVIRKYEETAPENSRFFCFLDCHDTVLGDRERRFDRIRPVEEGNAGYVLVFLRRGIAVLYNGNEIADNGMGSIFMPNDRKRDRTRVNWARVLQPSGKKRLAHIRTLAKIRHENPVFADGTQEWVTGGESQGALAFVRRLGDKAVFVAANLTGKKVEFSVGRDARSAGVILAERGELASDGTCRLGPWGYVVVDLKGDKEAEASLVAAPKLAFQVYAVRDLCEKDFVGTLKAAKALGYEGVETGRFYGLDAKGLKAACDDAGLELVALQLYPHNLTEPQLGETIRFCKESGCRRINVAWYKGSEENPNDWQLLVNVLNHAAEVCAKEGIAVAYHNHDHEFRMKLGGRSVWDWLYAEDGDDAMRQVTATPRFSRRVLQELDCGNCVLGGGDPLACLAAHPHRNPTVHVMPALGGPQHSADEQKRVPPAGECGVGSATDRVDWQRVIPALAADGVEWLVVKPTAHPDSLADLKASIEYLRSLQPRK